MQAIVDNDILLKGACYGILTELVSGALQATAVGILGSARFVVTKRIERCELQGDHDRALKVFLNFLSKATALEPADDEQKMAADLELAAQKLGVSLDSGESQLCAIHSIRLLPLLMTGDKRAIVAIERLLDSETRLGHIAGKVICLEQLFAILLTEESCYRLKQLVCAEPAVDKAISNCFNCHSDSVLEGSCREGLRSYIAALRTSAPRVLSHR